MPSMTSNSRSVLERANTAALASRHRSVVILAVAACGSCPRDLRACSRGADALRRPGSRSLCRPTAIARTTLGRYRKATRQTPIETFVRSSKRVDISGNSIPR
jgi:hypothetical protein